jgi:hypothetical protein
MHNKNSWLLTMALLTLVTAPCTVQSQGYDYGFGRPPGAVRAGIVRALYGTRGHYIDVTRIVRQYAWRGARMEVSNETFGFDPYKGKEKNFASSSPVPAAAMNGPGAKATPFASDGTGVVPTRVR